MDTLERRMTRLATSWQRAANTEIEAGNDTEEVFDAMLTVALGNLVQVKGPAAVANSLQLVAGMLIQNAGASATVARH